MVEQIPLLKGEACGVKLRKVRVGGGVGIGVPGIFLHGADLRKVLFCGAAAVVSDAVEAHFGSAVFSVRNNGGIDRYTARSGLFYHYRRQLAYRCMRIQTFVGSHRFTASPYHKYIVFMLAAVVDSGCYNARRDYSCGKKESYEKNVRGMINKKIQVKRYCVLKDS